MTNLEVMQVLQSLPEKYWTSKAGDYYHTQAKTTITRYTGFTGSVYDIYHDVHGHVYALRGYQIRKFCKKLDSLIGQNMAAEKNRVMLAWATDALNPTAAQ